MLRTFALYLVALKIAAAVINTVSFENGSKTWLLTALALTIFEYFLKPIAKILFLPINILTLGLLRWVINVIGLYLVTLAVKGFSVSSFYLDSFTWNGFSVPAVRLSTILTYVFCSFVINLAITVLKWLIKK
ncbi:phage holin family protein [Patescibacteria group bacterium]|nr:phage holin family protein [Patescibacteria group bacterium]